MNTKIALRLSIRSVLPFIVSLLTIFDAFGEDSFVRPRKNDDTIRITADHEGGCLDRAVKCGENFYGLVLRPDTWYYFNFRITGCKGKKIAFQFNVRETDHDGYAEGKGRWVFGKTVLRPVITYDGKSYLPADDIKKQPGGIKGAYIFTHTFTEDEAIVGYSETYLYSDLQKYLDEFCKQPLVKRLSIGKTWNGVNQDCLSITRNPDAKKTVFIISREDADEVTGSFSAEGMLNWVVSDDPLAVAFLNEYVLEFVPMVCVDGVIAGATHSCGYGYSGWNWHLEPAPEEIQNVRDYARKLGKSGREFVLAAKLHGGQALQPVKPRPDCLSNNQEIYDALMKYTTEYWNPRDTKAVAERPPGYFERFMQDEFAVRDIYGVHVQGTTPEKLRHCGRDLMIATVKFLNDRKAEKKSVTEK